MVVGIQVVNDKVMALMLVFEEGVVRLICKNALQVGMNFEEKPSLYDELKIILIFMLYYLSVFFDGFNDMCIGILMDLC